MFEKILVGYDGSERSEDALALARILAGLDGGHVIATCVYWDRPLAAGIAHGGPDAIPEDAELAQRTLPERFGSSIEVRSIADVSASRALHELAETEGADLVVVGSTGRGKVGQTLLGTTAERLLHGSPCPVAVAPLGYRDTAPERLKRVGAAYCADPEGLLAVDAAHAIARLASAELVVIGAYDGPSFARIRYGELGASELVVNPRESALGDLDEAVACLTDGVAVEAHLVDGLPADVLIERAATLDLLVMGSRAYGPLAHVLLGGVSHDVLLRCPSPVLVVPRGAVAPAGRRTRTAESASG
jgi:nucleotide-binding universal stress UspA family protein